MTDTERALLTKVYNLEALIEERTAELSSEGVKRLQTLRTHQATCNEEEAAKLPARIQATINRADELGKLLLLEQTMAALIEQCNERGIVP